MNKGLSEWPVSIFVMAITSVLFLIGGLWIGYESHPYEKCKQMYETLEDISECVWIKEHP